MYQRVEVIEDIAKEHNKKFQNAQQILKSNHNFSNAHVQMHLKSFKKLHFKITLWELTYDFKNPLMKKNPVRFN